MLTIPESIRKITLLFPTAASQTGASLLALAFRESIAIAYDPDLLVIGGIVASADR